MPWYRNLKTGQLFEADNGTAADLHMQEKRDDKGHPEFERTEAPREDEFAFDPSQASA